MSIDLHRTSFYSDLTKMVDYHNFTDFNRDSLHDVTIKRNVDLVKENYIIHWKHTFKHSQKLEFYSIFKNSHRPLTYLKTP